MWPISCKVSLVKMLLHNYGTKKVSQMGRSYQDNMGRSTFNKCTLVVKGYQHNFSTRAHPVLKGSGVDPVERILSYVSTFSPETSKTTEYIMRI